MKLSHLLSSEQLSNPELLDELLESASFMEQNEKTGNQPQTLTGKIIACLFFESSTRTRLSFEAATLKLGAKVIDMQSGMESSSTVKGESLEDTIKIVSGYADCIILRHPGEGTAERAAKVSSVPIINAGDGGNQHPTQTLLDLYTIKKEVGTFENLHIAFGLDPKHSRTIKSLALVLSKYKGLRASKDLLSQLESKGAKVEEAFDLSPGLDAHIFYINRLQGERFENPKEFENNRKKLVLTADMLKNKKVRIMNPLPRIDEMETSVDDSPNALYFKQAKNGLYVRMALLHKVLNS
jgi:aspartate carbamoyltransferase catalytic subunit